MTVENVLLVTIDSLRHDFREMDAPTMTTLAEEGTSFENAFATGPGTTPSFPGILTGTYPLSYGGLGKLSKDRPFLARKLSSRGMATAGFHSNPFLTESFNYDIGFDTFEDYQDSLIGIATKLLPQGIEKSVVPGPVTTALKKSYELVQGKPRPYERAEVITDDAIEWLERAPDGFFEWVHYMDAHHPCFPPDSYHQDYDLGDVSNGEISDLYSRAIENPDSVTEEKHRILVDSYRASLRYVDDQIGRLLSSLQEEDRFKDTMIIVTSDHGQLFGDFGEYGKPYRLYDALIKIPLVIQNAPAESRSQTQTLVSLVDLPPMIHDALGTDRPESYEGIEPDRNEPRESISVEHQVDDDVIVGVRTKEEKYVIDNINDEERGYIVNPEEQKVQKLGDISQSSRISVLERFNDLEVSKPDYVAQINEDTERRLEDLGYL